MSTVPRIVLSVLLAMYVRHCIKFLVTPLFKVEQSDSSRYHVRLDGSSLYEDGFPFPTSVSFH